ncbi:hypothetical protein BpHYR1_053797 [Brachionus plicatilis]|uniref:Uncharacterized protein n=1 Tax=Brachionus plicatilis TaxID=10195 RepID=A0A3M7TC14_BRAPC|nr:hypothetical protein BpHYR1_053797 [Brachionus plicatilis]
MNCLRRCEKLQVTISFLNKSSSFRLKGFVGVDNKTLSIAIIQTCFPDLPKKFYQYLLHLEQLKKFFHKLVTFTDHKGQD